VKRFCRKRKAPTQRLPLKKKSPAVVHEPSDNSLNTEEATETSPVTSVAPLRRDVSTQTEIGSTQTQFAETSTQTIHADLEREILKLKVEKKILANKIKLLEDSVNSYACNVDEISNSNSKCVSDKISAKLFSWSDVQGDDDLFRFYTGIAFSSFQTIWELLGEAKCKLSYWNRELVDKEKTPTKKSGPGRKLNPKNEFFMTLVRLRLGLLHEDLAFRFGVSSAHVSTVIVTWVQFLYHHFKSTESLFFPARQDLPKACIPKCFRKYRNLRVIIDCTEIFTQQSSDFGKQGNSYSHYKGNSTVKFLIGILPNGTVCFVSDGFEGSISDNDIVRQSGFLDKINAGDVVMADRGFLIKHDLMKKKAYLNIPPFLAGRDHFTAAEEARTKSIAKCRIHVERAIEKIKKFRIIKQTLPSSLTPVVSQTVCVIAMLVNHQQPLVR
jgi:hypothetical protein